MMWASRRQLAGWLVKDSPVACWPTTTSHSRKSTLMLPPTCWTWPITTPAAPMPRQSAKRGAALASRFCWMKALGWIERNRPEFCRSLRTTPAISAPTRSPAKSTIAIGTGSKVGRVMSMVSCARAGIVGPAASAAPPRIVDRRGSIMSNLLFINGASITRRKSVVARIEVEGDGAPGVELFRRQRPRLAARIHDGAMGGVGGGAIGRIAVVAPGLLEVGLHRRAVVVHLDDQGDDEGLVLQAAERIPARPDLVAHTLDLARRDDGGKVGRGRRLARHLLHRLGLLLGRLHLLRRLLVLQDVVDHRIDALLRRRFRRRRLGRLGLLHLGRGLGRFRRLLDLGRLGLLGLEGDEIVGR